MIAIDDEMNISLSNVVPANHEPSIEMTVLLKVVNALESLKGCLKGSNEQKVFSRKAGKLTHSTVHEMIARGLNGVMGFRQIKKLDAEERLAAMLRLYAFTMILKFKRIVNNEVIKSVSQVTESMIEDEVSKLLLACGL